MSRCNSSLAGERESVFTNDHDRSDIVVVIVVTGALIGVYRRSRVDLNVMLRVGARVWLRTTTVHHRNSAPEGTRFEDYNPRKSLIN